MIFLHRRSIEKRRTRLFKLYSRFLLNSNFTTIKRFKITRILQAQIDRVRLMTVRIDTERESLTQKWNDVWHFTDNSFVMQNENITTGDENTFAEIESNMSEIDTADTQLNISCSTKESKTHHCSNSNTIVEPFDRLCSLSVTSFEDQERRTVHANDHNERTSAIIDFASAIATRIFAPEQPQDQDDRAEAEKQEWKVIKILDKREIRSGTKYRVRWKSTWLLRSELENARRLLREYEAKGRAQHELKRGRLARKDKIWWSLYHFLHKLLSSQPPFMYEYDFITS